LVWLTPGGSGAGPSPPLTLGFRDSGRQVGIFGVTGEQPKCLVVDEGQEINNVPQHRFVKMTYFAIDLAKKMRYCFA
jgi:hypothetical protein